ncbi:MAG TPA: hypothetical protein PKC43_06200 [Phycisphaerales bacterium]|nr:hypothetical protein [Phycisphaerales bacterium]HMP37023.1 hypothetical protein [Phycisphaerales bacterium]
MRIYTAEIGDGCSRNGGGTTSFRAASLARAWQLAEEWTLEGDWGLAAPGESVEVTLSAGGRVIDQRRIVICEPDVAADIRDDYDAPA